MLTPQMGCSPLVVVRVHPRKACVPSFEQFVVVDDVSCDYILRAVFLQLDLSLVFTVLGGQLLLGN